MQNFMQIPPRGLLGKWVKYTHKFLFIYAFFSSAHPQVRPFKGFLRLMRQMMQFCTRKCLFGVRKLKFNIKRIYSQKSKELQWCLWGKLNNSLNGHNFGCV